MQRLRSQFGIGFGHHDRGCEVARFLLRDDFEKASDIAEKLGVGTVDRGVWIGPRTTSDLKNGSGDKDRRRERTPGTSPPGGAATLQPRGLAVLGGWDLETPRPRNPDSLLRDAPVVASRPACAITTFPRPSEERDDDAAKNFLTLRHGAEWYTGDYNAPR